MKTLIEKWSPILNYKFANGKSVPIDKHQDCAEDLEHLETKYTEAGMSKHLKNLIPFCAKSYAEEERFGGGVLELVKELTTKLEKK